MLSNNISSNDNNSNISNVKRLLWIINWTEDV